ncbi:unnamed protein product [Closterium sp. Yama58-4]|nr:unnamed protein product [Closterium sp. Yama58-4]
MTTNQGSTAQEKPQEAAARTLERAEPEPALPISAADAPSAVPAAAFPPQPVPPLLQYVPPLPQYVPPLPQYLPPHPQSAPPVAVMGTPVASPWPARCAKPENSRVVISRVEGGALEVRIPGEGGCSFWLLTLLLVRPYPHSPSGSSLSVWLLTLLLAPHSPSGSSLSFWLLTLLLAPHSPSGSSLSL